MISTIITFYIEVKLLQRHSIYYTLTSLDIFLNILHVLSPSVFMFQMIGAITIPIVKIRKQVTCPSRIAVKEVRLGPR